MSSTAVVPESLREPVALLGGVGRDSEEEGGRTEVGRASVSISVSSESSERSSSLAWRLGGLG